MRVPCCVLLHLARPPMKKKKKNRARTNIILNPSGFRARTPKKSPELLLITQMFCGIMSFARLQDVHIKIILIFGNISAVYIQVNTEM